MMIHKAKLLFYRLKKIAISLVDLILFFLRYSRIKRLCKQSLLWSSNTKSNCICPICQEGRIDTLIKLPLGYPIRQNHTLLYYNYDSSDIKGVLKYRGLLDRTAGFFLSVKWNFCPACKNASLGIDFSDQHIEHYLSKYFFRPAKSSEKRKNTKEIHSRYIDSFLNRHSNILEIGAAEGYAASYLSNQGHNIWVCEPSGLYHDVLAKKSELNIVNEISKLEDNFFDCIFLHHVLEHIPRPLVYLRKLFNLLRAGGLLFIQVPDLSLQLPLYISSLKWSIYSKFNPYSLNSNNGGFGAPPASKVYYWLDVLHNDHISAYTPEGLAHLLRMIGFDIKLVCQTTKDRLKINNKMFVWPVDINNGNTPNGLTVMVKK